MILYNIPMLPILQVPNPILRQKSKPVAHIDTKVIGFIQQLESTLVNQDHPKGVGLSAIQVGKPWRIFCTYLPRPKPVIKIFINPQITAKSKVLTLGPDQNQPILEGCLSIPLIYGPVWRHQWIKLRWQMANGKWTMDKFSDFEARVIQHELDHLNGILFPDRSLRDHLPLYEDRSDQLTPINLDTPR